ncbi:unnamed protein product [Camellia sinensis]
MMWLKDVGPTSYYENISRGILFKPGRALKDLNRVVLDIGSAIQVQISQIEEGNPRMS